MSLVKMSQLLDRATRNGICCGSFSVNNMEGIIGIIKAAEELDTPVILQVAEARLPHSPFHIIAPMMLSAAREAKVEVAVHLDHGMSFQLIERALNAGFTSVMYDGSTLPLEKNIEDTNRVCEMAKAFGADVEAELGLVGKSEDGSVEFGVSYTKPEDADAFLKACDITALAVAIGNQHGNYKEPPKLRLDVLEQIHGDHPEVPLVLHGGSGISDEDFQNCIRRGIRKINIATATLNSMVAEAGSYLSKTPKPDYYGLNEVMVKGAYENAKHHIRVFNMEKL